MAMRAFKKNEEQINLQDRSPNPTHNKTHNVAWRAHYVEEGETTKKNFSIYILPTHPIVASHHHELIPRATLN